MSTQDQARALMVRQQHLLKNREQSVLSRAAAELGISTDTVVRNDRNHVGLS